MGDIPILGKGNDSTQEAYDFIGARNRGMSPGEAQEYSIQRAQERRASVAIDHLAGLRPMSWSPSTYAGRSSSSYAPPVYGMFRGSLVFLFALMWWLSTGFACFWVFLRWSNAWGGLDVLESHIFYLLGFYVLDALLLTCFAFRRFTRASVLLITSGVMFAFVSPFSSSLPEVLDGHSPASDHFDPGGMKPDDVALAREVLNPTIDYLNQRYGQAKITSFSGIWVQRQQLGNNAQIALTPLVGTAESGTTLPRMLCSLARSSSTSAWQVTRCTQ